MGKPLSTTDREALFQVCEAEGGAALFAELERQKDDGHDVAGMPFRLLDRLFSAFQTPSKADLAPLARLLPGGQPDLFGAILESSDRDDPGPLKSLAGNADAHVKTRWEARCWQVFMTHRCRADPAQASPPRPVRRIVHFWDDANPPPEIDTALTVWSMSGVETRRFDEQHAARFIARNLGPDVEKLFQGLWHPAIKSDLFRLCYLLVRGGLYADADSLPGEGVPGFLSAAGGLTIAGTMTRLPRAFTNNGFMSAPPGAPVIAAFLDYCLAMLRIVPHRNIYWLTGPGAFTQFLSQSDHEITLLPAAYLKAELFSQIDAPYKKTEANWRVYEHRRGLSDRDILKTLF